MDHWERKKDAKFWFLAQVERNCERNIQRLDLGKKPFFSMSTVFQFKQDPETKRRTVLDESYLACDGTAKAMAASFRRRISERRKPKVDSETEKREKARKESEHRAEVLPPDISKIRCRALIAML